MLPAAAATSVPRPSPTPCWDACPKRPSWPASGRSGTPDSVRALGLLPLDGRKEREADLLDRYQVLQEFLRGSRTFGTMRQVSEKTAVAIGLENLARTAGYPDPVRLEWAMEAQSVADLAAGPVARRPAT